MHTISSELNYIFFFFGFNSYIHICTLHSKLIVRMRYSLSMSPNWVHLFFFCLTNTQSTQSTLSLCVCVSVFVSLFFAFTLCALGCEKCAMYFAMFSLQSATGSFYNHKVNIIKSYYNHFNRCQSKLFKWHKMNNAHAPCLDNHIVKSDISLRTHYILI